MSEQKAKSVGEWAGKGDLVEKVTEVDPMAKTVRAIRTVKRNATDDMGLVCEWKFDFSRMSEVELLEMATRQAVIDVQAMVRTSKDKVTDWTRKTFEYPLERERTTKTAFEKVTAAVAGGKLSDAERAALLAMLKGE